MRKGTTISQRGYSHSRFMLADDTWLDGLRPRKRPVRTDYRMRLAVAELPVQPPGDAFEAAQVGRRELGTPLLVRRDLAGAVQSRPVAEHVIVRLGALRRLRRHADELPQRAQGAIGLGAQRLVSHLHPLRAVQAAHDRRGFLVRPAPLVSRLP